MNRLLICIATIWYKWLDNKYSVSLVETEKRIEPNKINVWFVHKSRFIGVL